MSDLSWTESYLDTLSKDIGGIDTVFKKGFALTSAIPVWLAEKGANSIVSIPQTIKVLKEVMYKSPESFDPEEYEGKMLELAGTVLGGGLGSSSLVKGETGGSILAMNKAEGLKQWATTAYKNAQSLEGEQKKTFLDKAQAVYQMLDKQLTQREFDWINGIGVEQLTPGKYAHYVPTTKTIGVDLLQSVDPNFARVSAAHEFIHGGQWGIDNTATAKLMEYKIQDLERTKNAIQSLEQSSGLNPNAANLFTELMNTSYAHHDPTEAMARYASQEIATDSSVQLGKVFDEYLDRFVKGHEEFAAGPREKKGFSGLLGPEFEKFFKDVYTDRLLTTLE